MTSSTESQDAPQILEQLRHTIQIGVQKGLSIEKTFSHFDRNQKGAITATELAHALNLIPKFKGITATIVQKMFSPYAGADGLITIKVFKRAMNAEDEKEDPPQEYVEIKDPPTKQAPLAQVPSASSVPSLEQTSKQNPENPTTSKLELDKCIYIYI